MQTNKNAPKNKVTKCTHFYRKWKPLSGFVSYTNNRLANNRYIGASLVSYLMSVPCMAYSTNWMDT